MLLPPDPDHHVVRNNQPICLRDIVLPILSQDIHHPLPTGEEREEAHHEH